ncbi:MAG: TlpA family protein disulfide reductase [Pseudobutyrivibrio sp.]|nr:TlpA family protein disulfide reductase [Pseudobutyrivibrio sp.]
MKERGVRTPEDKRQTKTLIILSVLVVVCLLVFNLVLFIQMATGTGGLGRAVDFSKGDVNVFDSFGGTDLEGNTVNSEVLKKSKITVLNIWATNCHWCVAEMPEMADLIKEYDPADIQLIGLCAGTIVDRYNSMPESAQSIISSEARDLAMNNRGDEFLQILPSEKFEKDIINSAACAFPTTLVINSEGMVIGIHSGANDYDHWKTIFDSYVRGNNNE